MRSCSPRPELTTTVVMYYSLDVCRIIFSLAETLLCASQMGNGPKSLRNVGFCNHFFLWKTNRWCLKNGGGVWKTLNSRRRVLSPPRRSDTWRVNVSAQGLLSSGRENSLLLPITWIQAELGKCAHMHWRWEMVAENPIMSAGSAELNTLCCFCTSMYLIFWDWEECCWEGTVRQFHILMAETMYINEMLSTTNEVIVIRTKGATGWQFSEMLQRRRDG